MRQVVTISESVVNQIKAKIAGSGLSLHAIANITGVSYYTVWCISKGKYDTKEPLQKKSSMTGEMFVETAHENWLV